MVYAFCRSAAPLPHKPGVLPSHGARCRQLARLMTAIQKPTQSSSATSLLARTTPRSIDSMSGRMASDTAIALACGADWPLFVLESRTKACGKPCLPGRCEPEFLSSESQDHTLYFPVLRWKTTDACAVLTGLTPFRPITAQSYQIRRCRRSGSKSRLSNQGRRDAPEVVFPTCGPQVTQASWVPEALHPRLRA